jgi:hypothetical protein
LGQSATCTFTNRVSSTGLPPTGASGVQQLIGLAWLVAVSGGALLLVTRRSARRPA